MQKPEPNVSGPERRRFRSLVSRIVVLCLTLYLVVTAIFTLTEAILAGVRVQDNAEKDLTALMTAYLPPLRSAVWNMDSSLIQLLLNNMAQSEVIAKVHFLDPQQQLLAQATAPNLPMAKDLVGPEQVISLQYASAGRPSELIGFLHIYPSLAAQWERQTEILLFGLIRTILLIFVLSIILVAAINYYLGRPLARLTRQLQIADHQRLTRLELGHKPADELWLFTEAFNTLWDRVTTLNESLEVKVAQRTLDLERSNQELEKANEVLETTRDQLVSSTKMAVLGRLTAGVAHELNTPLGAMLSASQHLDLEFQKSLSDLIFQAAQFSAADRECLFSLVFRDQSFVPLNGLQRSREKQEVAQRLAKAGSPLAEVVADVLMQIDLVSISDELIGRVATIQQKEFFELVLALYNLASSCRIIGIAAEKMSQVVGDLRAYSYSQPREDSVSIDLIQEVKSILRLFRNALRGHIEVDFQADLVVPRILGRPDRLQQVWINLISNALQAMGGHGKLSLNVHALTPREVEVRVTDTGPGIPPELSEHLFEPFVTSKPAGVGLGLGLSICKRIIDEHNGRIHVESRPGHTEFRVSFPAQVQS